MIDVKHSIDDYWTKKEGAVSKPGWPKDSKTKDGGPGSGIKGHTTAKETSEGGQAQTRQEQESKKEYSDQEKKQIIKKHWQAEQKKYKYFLKHPIPVKPEEKSIKAMEQKYGDRYKVIPDFEAVALKDDKGDVIRRDRNTGLWVKYANGVHAQRSFNSLEEATNPPKQFPWSK